MTHLDRFADSTGTRLTTWSGHVDAVPMSTAVYCLDCGLITGSVQRCAVCGSNSIIVLARIFDREVEA